MTDSGVQPTMLRGKKWGTFVVLRTLGRGGMGEMLEVRPPDSDCTVALKRFTSHGTHAAFLRKRFLAEGRLLQRLDHPGLVKVHELGIEPESDTPYFTMDLVLGADGNPCTLEDERKRQIMDEARLEMVYSQLREALLYLHGEGVVHRDVKLENVLVAADGSLRLSDFGISRILDDRLRDADAVTTTMTGESAPVMGSAAYFAPEVRAGEAATPASDIWALGVLVFRLLTGVWYEPGTAADDLLAGFEPVWRNLLDAMLARDPKRRSLPAFATCQARVKRHRSLWTWIAGASVLVVVGLTALFLFWPHALREDAVEAEGKASVPFSVDGTTAQLALGPFGNIDFVLCPTGHVDLVQDWRNGKTAPVELTRPYWIMKYPLTRRESALYPPLDPPPGVVDEEHFRNYVCLNRAQAEGLCAFFNRRFAEALPEGYEVRLPTLAEWEFAFHAGAADSEDPFFDLLHIHQQDAVYEAIYHDYDRGDKPRTKRLNAWGIGDWCGKEKVYDTFDPAELVAPEREEKPSFYQVRTLPSPQSTTDWVYRSDATNRVNLIRMPAWVRWEATTRDFAEDWCPIRLVIGPKL